MSNLALSLLVERTKDPDPCYGPYATALQDVLDLVLLDAEALSDLANGAEDRCVSPPQALHTAASSR